MDKSIMRGTDGVLLASRPGERKTDMSDLPWPDPDQVFDWPSFALEDDVRKLWREAATAGERLALATLVDRSGPSPRPVGSQMAVSESGRIAGYVSGGCVESNLAAMAVAAFSSAAPQTIVFGDGSPYMDVRLPCGTRIDIVLDVVAADDPAAALLLALSDDRRCALWLGGLDGFDHRCIAAADHAAADLPSAAAGRQGNLYWKRYVPPLRLVLNGGDPVALALARLAGVFGFEVILNRQHGPEAAPAGLCRRYLRLDGAALMQEITVDPWTAIVSTTHDIEADHSVLAAALPSPAFYVGVLGSRRHMADRKALFQRDHVPVAAARRLKAPLGLDIGAATAHEIALSTLAEIVAVWRGQ